MKSVKREVLAVTALLILAFSIRTLFNPLGNLDEIWVYQYSRRLMSGQIPYKDFYMLVWPLSVQINAIALLAFGDQLYTLRIVAIAVSSGVGMFVFVASRQLGLSPVMCLLPLFGVAMAQNATPYNSYTWFALLFLTAALVMQLATLRDGTTARMLLVGLLLGLAAIAKQNVGLPAIGLAAMFLLVFDAQPNRFVKVIYLSAGFSIPLLAELLWLINQGALPAFFENTVLGVLRFDSDASLPTSTSQLIVLAVFLLLAPLSAGYAFIRRNTGNYNPILLASLYAIAASLIIIPRPDVAHVRHALFPVLLVVAYWVSKPALFDRHAVVMAGACLVIFFVALPFVDSGHGLVVPTADRIETSTKNFAKIPISRKVDARLVSQKKFLEEQKKQGKNIYFLGLNAALYSIVTDQMGGYYMIPAVGNLGPNGVHEISGSISNDPDALVVFPNEIHPLEPPQLRKFVQKTLQLIESTPGFDVYAHARESF